MTDHYLTDQQAQEIAQFEQVCEEEYQVIQRAEKENALLYAVITTRLAIPVRFLQPDKLSPDWYSPRRFDTPAQAIEAFLGKYPDAVRISPDALEEASWERLAREGLAR